MRDARWEIFERCLASVQHLHGDIVEVGVHRGNSLVNIGIIRDKLKLDKVIYGIDTFEGMPNTVIDGLDNGFDINGKPGVGGHKPGDFSDSSLGLVQQNMSSFSNVVLIKGFFPDCAIDILNRQFCFAHVDVDIYQSTKDAYDVIWPQLVPGGVVVCGDDYGKPWLKGATLAIDEAAKKFGVYPTIVDGCGVHILVKP